MELLVKLKETLISAQEEKMTGHAYLYFDSDSPVGSVRIAVSNGRLHNILGSNKKAYASLNGFIVLPIKKVMFMPNSAGVDKRNAGLQIELNDLVEVISQVVDTGMLPSTSGGSSSLEEEMKELFGRLFGPKIAAKIGTLAKKHSPTDEPKAFLDSCKDVLGVMVGEDKAKEVLSQFYKRLIKT